MLITTQNQQEPRPVALNYNTVFDYKAIKAE